MYIFYRLSIADVINQIDSKFLYYDTRITPSIDEAFSFYKKTKSSSCIYIDCINKFIDGRKILFIIENSDLISFCKLYTNMFTNTIDLRKALDRIVILRQLIN